MIDQADKESTSGWLLDKIILPNAKLRQGDLVRFPSVDDPIRKCGIIVTADCDLSQKKHARIIAMVPVVSARLIIERYLLPEDCERKRDVIERYAFDRRGIDSSQTLDIKLGILREAIGSNPSDPGTAQDIAERFLFIDESTITASSYKKLMEALRINPKKSESFKSQLRSKGDLLILPDTQGLGIDGNIAWIRLLWQAPMSDIAIRTSEIPFRSGERLARLDSPYRYRLTQLIAQVFSDIGLPDTPNAIDRLVEEAYSDA